MLDLLFIGEERIDFSRMIQGNRTVSQIIKTTSRPLHYTQPAAHDDAARSRLVPFCRGCRTHSDAEAGALGA
jgi:hypothetical protein